MTAVAHAPALGARVLRSAVRGAVLVGAAIVMGIILLNVVNGVGSPGGSSRGATPGTTATTGVTPPTTTGKQLKLVVFNGSGVSGAATAEANKLRGLGYAILFTGNSTTPQTGTTVACKSDVSVTARDTLTKAAAIGATVASFPSPVPTTALSADCIVTVGK
jgi:LytR cell envelope-related transcriptional attenuator